MQVSGRGLGMRGERGTPSPRNGGLQTRISGGLEGSRWCRCVSMGVATHGDGGGGATKGRLRNLYLTLNPTFYPRPSFLPSQVHFVIKGYAISI